MNFSNYIVTEDLKVAENFFSKSDLIKAKKLIEDARINISFQKGSTERYFIISGILNDGNSNEARVSFKKNDDLPDGLVTSNCNCINWSSEKHCSHSAGLFLKFYQNQRVKDNIENRSEHESLKANIITQGNAVHVDEYGRVVSNANKLIGAHTNSTYSSLQYLLVNRKIVNFPTSMPLKGKVQVNFIKAFSLKEFKNFPNIEDKYYPIFSFLDADGNTKKKVSIFENLYLFDWEEGSSFNLPAELKNLIKKFQIDGFIQDINYFYKTITSLKEEDYISFSINDTPINTMEYKKINYQFSINPSARKSYLELSIQLFDDDKKVINIPSFFNLMINDDGLLDSFRTKSASFNFIETLVDSLEYEHQEYKKHMYASSKKKRINQLIDYININDELVHVDADRALVYFTQNKFIKELFVRFYKSFGFNASRYSFKRDSKELIFEVPKNQLLNGVFDFHKFLAVYKTPLYYNQKEVKTWNSNIRFEREKSNMNWFDLSLVISEDDFEIIKAANSADEYIIANDQLIILDSKEKELLKFMKKYTLHEATNKEIDSTQIKKFSLNFKKARIFELFELKKHGIEGALTPEEEVLCEELMNLDEMPKFDLPAQYQEIARNYQVTGYNWLRFLHKNQFGACLADDMGLGKTLQTIMFLQSIIENVERVLIVCPVSLLVNWQNEFNKFSDIDVQVYYGNDRGKEFEKKIILTSYGIMKKESYTTFEKTNFDILIMDEVQHLKNIRSQGALAARNLKSNFTICLTGTPVENDLSEFYNILDLSVPGIWGELSFLKTTSTKKSRLLARKTVKPFILRRTKDQVLTELPEKVENLVYLEFSEKEKENYITTLASIRKKIEEAQKGRQYSEILKSLLKLRQLCLWQQNQFLESTKITYLMENLEQLMDQGHKVLVFSQFTTYLDLIQNKVQERSWNYARIDGSQNLKKRASEVERFQEGDANVFLISLKAGGVGLNLTAASYIFLMDPWWNPAVESQAVDRAYRIGQKNKLTVYRPIIKNSVEEKVLVLQNNKRELFKDLMAEGEDQFYDGKLKMEDFQSLIY